MRATLSQFLIWASALLVAATAPAFALFAQPPNGGATVVLAIAPPWSDFQSEFERDGTLKEAHPLRAPFGVLVSIENENDLNKLYSLGSAFVVDGEAILSLCSS